MRIVQRGVRAGWLPIFVLASLSAGAQTRSGDPAYTDDALARAQDQFRRSAVMDSASVRSEISELAAAANKLLAAGDPRGAAGALVRMGECHRFLYEYKPAHDAFERAVRSLPNGSHDEVRANAIRGMAETELELKQPDTAEASINTGLPLAEKAGDERLRLLFLILRSRVRSARSDPQAALADLNIAANSSLLKNNFELTWKTYTERAGVYLDMGLACSQLPPGAAKGACTDALSKAEQDAKAAGKAAEDLGYFLAVTVATRLAFNARLQTENLMIRYEMNRRGPQGSFDDLIDRLNRLATDLKAEHGRIERLRDQSKVPANPIMESAWSEIWPKAEALIQELIGLLRNPPGRAESKPPAPQRIPFLDPVVPEDVVKVEVAAKVDLDLALSFTGLLTWIADRGDEQIARRYEQARQLFTKDHDASLNLLLGVLEALESERSTITGDQSRSLMMGGRVEMYDRMVLNLLHRDRFADAFALLEKTRARSLAELLAARPPVLNERVNATLASVFQMRAGISSLTKSGRLSEAAAGRLVGLQAKLDAAVDELGRMEPKLLQLYTPKLLGYNDARTLAAADRIDIVQYMVTPSKVVIWHIGPQKQKATAILLNREQLMGKLLAFREALGNPTGSAESRAAYDDRISRQLYLFLIEPIRDSIETDHLVFVPRDELANLPFAVLRSPDGSFLGENFKVSIAPSMTIFAGLPKPRSLSDARLLAVANPHLFGKAQQAQLVRMYPSAKLLVGPSAGQVKAERNYDALYFATHGEFRMEDPMLARLILTGGPDQPGNTITAAEAFALALQAVRVVVVGACDVGQVAIERTNEMYGLARALLYAGTQSLVLPYWKIENAAAARWAEVFFSEARSRPLADAVRQAIRRVKAQYPHPGDWGAFYYLGR